MTNCAFDRIGVGEKDHVALFYGAIKTVEKRADIRTELADDHLAFAVGDQWKGIALFADAGRHRGAHQSRVHLDARVAQGVFDDFERYRVDWNRLERRVIGLNDSCGHSSFPQAKLMRMLPSVSTVPVHPASISVVESISITMAGPGMMSLARSLARS